MQVSSHLPVVIGPPIWTWSDCGTVLKELGELTEKALETTPSTLSTGSQRTQVPCPARAEPLAYESKLSLNGRASVFPPMGRMGWVPGSLPPAHSCHRLG